MKNKNQNGNDRKRVYQWKSRIKYTKTFRNTRTLHTKIMLFCLFILGRIEFARLAHTINAFSLAHYFCTNFRSTFVVVRENHRRFDGQFFFFFSSIVCVCVLFAPAHKKIDS